jgi:hypothetical protein
MRARLGLPIFIATLVGTASSGCARDNPAFDTPLETHGSEGMTADDSDELPPESGEESPELCDLAGGMDMTIEVPQPCGETNDPLGIYQHYFKVVEAASSTWQVQFCDANCVDCVPVPSPFVLSPLPVAELAGPDACLLVTGRRLGSGDDCSYHTLSVVDVSANGGVLVLARRTNLLDLPTLDTSTGLASFEPGLVEAETCDCSITPDSCCDGQTPTRYDYDVNGTIVPIGETQPITIGQRSYDFWAFDAFESGDCDAPISVSWALVAG